MKNDEGIKTLLQNAKYEQKIEIILLKKQSVIKFIANNNIGMKRKIGNSKNSFPYETPRMYKKLGEYTAYRI